MEPEECGDQHTWHNDSWEDTDTCNREAGHPGDHRVKTPTYGARWPQKRKPENAST